jgi:protein involved in polysaccharide export with SLBB domain
MFVRKSFNTFIFLVLVGAFSNHVAGQANTKSQALTNLNNQKNPIGSAPKPASSATESSAEAKALFEAGMRQTEAGEPSQAAESFQQALRLDPEYADAYAALGRAYFKMRQWQKAIDNLHRASELNAKQREANDVLKQRVSIKKSEEPGARLNATSGGRPETKLEQATNVKTGVKTLPSASVPTEQSEQRKETNTQAKGTPTRPQIKPQETNTNAGGMKILPLAPVTNEQLKPRKETNTAANATPASPQTKPPQATNANAAGLKTLPSTTAATAQPEQRKESNTPAKAISTSAETKPPQATNANAAGLKTLPSTTTAIAQPEQRKETSTAANATPASPQTKPPQATNATAAGLKTLPSTTAAIAQPEQRKESNTPAKAISTSAETKPPQATNANAAGLKTLPSTTTAIAQPEQRKESNTPAKAISTSAETKPPQGTNTNAAAVNPWPPDSQTTQQPGQAAGAVLPLKGDHGTVLEEKQEPDGVRVSMNVPPSSSPLETKNVTSIPTEASSTEVSATTIYRVGPNDVLDIHLNNSHSPQSTLFTVTPSGLLEHPMLPEPLLVTGFTADEIGTKIENELNRLELIQNSKVIVGVRDYASHAILVSGLVQDPGTRFLRREAVPLYVVVADAQPLPEAARITVVRNEQKRIYEMDLAQAADMNFLVRPGDVVTLNPNVTQFIYIGGEVKSPGEKTFRRGLTLMQAIIAAGGVTPKSKGAEIGRDDGRGFLVGTRFDLQGIRSGKTADPLLRPGDRIMILR